MDNAKILNKDDYRRILDSYTGRAICCYQDLNREYSWRSCYEAFGKLINIAELNMEQLEYLELQLGFYLASWGMYRESSFLIDYSYKIYEPVIVMIRRYSHLYGLSVGEVKEHLDEIMKLKSSLEDYLRIYRDYFKKKNRKPIPNEKVSETLTSKIMLGTLGCVPAYDEFFVMGLRKTNDSTKSFTSKSIKTIADLYAESGKFDGMRSYLESKGIHDYPDMKIIDMFYWECGQKEWSSSI